MRTLWQDLRYGARMLLKNRGLTFVAVLSLALGIGANTSIFSLINAVMFKPLPVRNPEQLVALYTTEAQGDFSNAFSYPDYVDYRDHNEVFTALVGHAGIPLSLSSSDAKSDGGSQPELIWGEAVTGNYFSGLGVETARGRTFTLEEDDAPGTHPVAVLNYNFWQRRFGADASVIGKTLTLNGHDFTVVGVAGKNFTGTKFLGFTPDVWVPLMMYGQLVPESSDRLAQRGSHWLELRGRLKPGVSMEQARAAMNVVARQLHQAYPKTDGDETMHVISGKTKVEPFLVEKNLLPIASGLLMSLVGIVLLIACANVANLLLARASVRRREIAIRLALGASRARLIRQLLTESLLLSVLGGALGLLLALWFTDLIVAGSPTLDFPVDYGVQLDVRVLGFAILLSLFTGIIFGLAPALQASRPELVTALKNEASASGKHSRGVSLRSVLVIAQVALSLVLLVSAGLFIKSTRNAQRVETGFDVQHLLLMSVDVGLQGYDEAKARAFYKRVIERVENVPGVRHASFAFPLPLDAYGDGRGVLVEGQMLKGDERPPTVSMSIAGPEFLETLGTQLVQGRDFNARDKEDAPRVVIINETMAHRFFGSSAPNALGKRLSVSGPAGPYLEVIGVAADGKYGTLGEDPQPYLFLPLLQHYASRITLVARTEGSPQALIDPVRREIHALDANLPVFGVKTGVQFMQRLQSASQGIATLTGIFGLLALLLAMIGIYGVMAYMVAQRTHEIGIRIALGAQSSDVLKLVVGHGLWLVLIGVGLGLIGALAATRVMASLLYGVSATDPLIFASVALLLTIIALVACYVPARRATKVDPMIALRHE